MQQHLKWISVVEWLIIAFGMGGLIFVLLRSSNRGPIENSFLGLTAIILFWSVWKAYKTVKTPVEEAVPLWRQATDRQPNTTQTQAMPISRETLDRIQQVLNAMMAAELLSHEQCDRVVAYVHEDDPYEGEYGAEEVFGVVHELGDAFRVPIAFTTEHVEVYAETIAELTTRVLALMGHEISSRAVEVKHATSDQINVAFELGGKSVTIPCRPHAKYTPEGLIEGLARQSPPDRSLYTELICGHMITIVCLSKPRAEAFNQQMESIDDPFRLVKERTQTAIDPTQTGTGKTN